MNQYDYYRLYHNQVIIREWDIEDMFANSITMNPANNTMLQKFSKETDKIEHIIYFKAENNEKQTIRGLVIESGQWIPRKDVDGKGNFGYCYFSKATVQKMYDMFFSNKLTLNHKDDITGDAILVESKLEKSDKKYQWFLEYRIQSKRLWEYVKQNPVGYSIEGLFNALKLNNSL